MNMENVEVGSLQVKRLNTRNRELHVEARPYTELKDYVEKKDINNYDVRSSEKLIKSLPYSDISSFCCTPIKLVSKTMI
jgi:hypothetical protein